MDSSFALDHLRRKKEEGSLQETIIKAFPFLIVFPFSPTILNSQPRCLRLPCQRCCLDQYPEGREKPGQCDGSGDESQSRSNLFRMAKQKTSITK